MANRIKTQTYVNVNQILFNTDPQVSVGVLVSNSGIDAGSDGRKVCPDAPRPPRSAGRGRCR